MNVCNPEFLQSSQKKSLFIYFILLCSGRARWNKNRHNNGIKAKNHERHCARDVCSNKIAPSSNPKNKWKRKTKTKNAFVEIEKWLFFSIVRFHGIRMCGGKNTTSRNLLDKCCLIMSVIALACPVHSFAHSRAVSSANTFRSASYGIVVISNVYSKPCVLIDQLSSDQIIEFASCWIKIYT